MILCRSKLVELPELVSLLMLKENVLMSIRMMFVVSLFIFLKCIYRYTNAFFLSVNKNLFTSTKCDSLYFLWKLIASVIHGAIETSE